MWKGVINQMEKLLYCAVLILHRNAKNKKELYIESYIVYNMKNNTANNTIIWRTT